ncbi:hypothetical protein [Helicobacter sp. 23-1045]
MAKQGEAEVSLSKFSPQSLLLFFSRNAEFRFYDVKLYDFLLDSAKNSINFALRIYSPVIARRIVDSPKQSKSRESKRQRKSMTQKMNQ